MPTPGHRGDFQGDYAQGVVGAIDGVATGGDQRAVPGNQVGCQDGHGRRQTTRFVASGG
jgi:hypothetical protein